MKYRKEITTIFKKLDIHTFEVLTKSISSFFVKAGGVLIGLVVSVSLGRILGPDGYGIINLAEKILNILIVLGLFGVRQLIVKNVAIAKEEENYQLIGDTMHSAYKLNGGGAIILSILFIFLSPWISENIFHESRLTIPLMIFLVGLAPQVFSRIISSGLIGYRKIWQSNLVEQTLSITLTGVFVLIAYLSGIYISVSIVALFYVLGRIGVTLSVSLYWNKLFSFQSKWEVKPISLFFDSLPMFLSTVSTIIISNADVIILGIFVDSSYIGLYGIAIKVALLTSFLLQITNSSIGPKIAALYQKGNIKETQKMVQKVTRVLLVFGLISIFLFIIIGEYILSFWGEEFIDAYFILIILSFGQLFNIGTGAAGQLLTMTGFEKINRNISIICMVLNLIFGFIFIKSYGINGAAIVNSITVIILNISRVYFAKKLTGISTI